MMKIALLLIDIQNDYFPGGKMELVEPLAAAKRELLEETGYESDDWVSLGSYRVDPNRGWGAGLG